jgi:hypothetical protein
MGTAGFGIAGIIAPGPVGKTMPRKRQKRPDPALN